MKTSLPLFLISILLTAVKAESPDQPKKRAPWMTVNMVKVTRPDETRSKEKVDILSGAEKFLEDGAVAIAIGYSPSYKITYPEKSKQKVELVVWIQNEMMYPGWNSPIAELFMNGARIGAFELKEVGMPRDIWADTYDGKMYLFVLNSFRYRYAKGTFTYLVDVKERIIKLDGLHFEKKELETEWKEMTEDAKKKEGSQK